MTGAGAPQRAVWALLAIVAAAASVKGAWDGVYFARTTEAVQQARSGLILVAVGVIVLLGLAAVGATRMHRATESILAAVAAVLTGATVVLLPETLIPPVVALLGGALVLVAAVLMLVPRS